MYQYCPTIAIDTQLYLAELVKCGKCLSDFDNDDTNILVSCDTTLKNDTIA